jgi:hypothetical protein
MATHNGIEFRAMTMRDWGELARKCQDPKARFAYAADAYLYARTVDGMIDGLAICSGRTSAEISEAFAHDLHAAMVAWEECMAPPKAAAG